MGKISINCMKFFFAIFVILALLFSCGNPQKNKPIPKAVNGVLDLRGWDFEKEETIKLDGDWEFYWKQFYSYNDFKNNQIIASNYIQVPRSWNGYEWNKEKLGAEGYATYRLKVFLDKKYKNLSFKFLDEGTSFNAFLNERLILSSGIVSANPEEASPRSRPQTVDFQTDLTEFELIVHISNFANNRGGFWQSIALGSIESIHSVRNKSVAMDLLVAGCLLMMGIYHLGLFSLRKKDKSTFWFGMFCLMFVLRTLITGEKYLIYLYPSLPFYLTVRLEYMSFYFQIPIFVLFLHSLFPDELNKKMLYAIQIIAYPFCLFCFSPSFRFLSSTLTIVQIITAIVASYSVYVNIVSILHGRLGARTFLVGFLIFFISLVNDILYNRNIVNTAYISTHGFLAFIFSQSFVLSMRFSKSFATSEALAVNLEKSNQELLKLKENLEIKVIERTKELQQAKEIVEIEKEKSEKLLLNILPEEVADELKLKGEVKPVYFESISVMFTDFKGFTQIAEGLSAENLIKELDACFTQFDKIAHQYRLEKLKTIGDSYMCAGGIPRVNTTHATDCCLAAIEIQGFIDLLRTMKKLKNIPYWELRLGIHTGPVMAGVVGEKKFAYDVWGDTVNIASRMESSGTPGRINISYATYEAVKDKFECEYRGKVNAKNKGDIDMYYLNRIKPEFSKDALGRTPNAQFFE